MTTRGRGGSDRHDLNQHMRLPQRRHGEAPKAVEGRDDLVLEKIYAEYVFLSFPYGWAWDALWRRLRARNVLPVYNLLLGSEAVLPCHGCVDPQGIRLARGSWQGSVETPAVFEGCLEYCFAPLTGTAHAWLWHRAP